ncbi:Abc transporter c family member 2, partial [Globisporangium splendens]
MGSKKEEGDADGYYVAEPPTPNYQGPRDLEHGSEHNSPKSSSVLAKYAQHGPFCQQPNPLSAASFVSIISAHWLQPLISLGACKVLELQDLWPVAEEDRCDVVYERLMRVYKPELREKQTDGETHATLANSPLIAAFLETFRRDIIIIFAAFFIYTFALALQSYIAQAILDHLNDRTNVFHIDNGYVLVAMMTVTSFVAVTSMNHGFFFCSRIGVNIRSSTMDLVYQKALRLSSVARQEYTSGEIVTLMSVDTERVFNCMTEGFWTIVSPFSFVLTIVLIAFLFDILSALCGALLLVVIMWASIVQARQIGELQSKLLSIVDERVRLTSEALHGIRVMKFYAWEDALARRIERLRDVEVRLQRKFHTLQVFNTAMLFLTPTLLSGVTFAAYFLIRGEISVIEAFTLVAMANVCRGAVLMFPRAIASASQARIAVRRLDTYLASDELVSFVDNYTCISDKHAGRISVRDAYFEWRQSESQGFSLQDINVEVSSGSLVMIVGTVGSGKSSLLNALLGEMAITQGRVDVTGEIAYVSQESWIRNSSVKDNILFEDAFDADRYQRVLEATQLALDLHALPNGDQTEIGERGINLSGGQKTRVAIARAMYRSKYDILILDDPLSAVDPHVAHAIFNQCIVGLAKDKTRLLVLNSHYDLLQHADKILVVQDGCVAGDGTYNEILSQFPELGMQSATLDKLEKDVIDEHDNTHEHEHEMSKAAVNTESGLPGKSNAATLVQKEDRVKGKVSGHIYKSYFDGSGADGVLIMALLGVIYAVSQGVRTLVDWWQGHWAKNMARDGVDPGYSDLRFGMWYLGLVVLCCLLTVIRGQLLVEACIRSSKSLHNEMFRRVLSAPVNSYFDVTPVGRILNRFSNDLDQMDTILPQQYQQLFQNIAVTIGALIVSATSSYWIGISYIPMLVVFVAVGVYFKQTSREVKRLDGITRTPVYNLFDETLSGLPTIRAFKMQDTFIHLNKNAIDANTTAYFTYWMTGRWLAARLDWMSVVIIFVVSLYLVATKGQISAVVGGLSLTYSLMLTSTVQTTVRSFDRTDNAMTSVERLLHFRSISREEDESIANDHAVMTHEPWPSQGAITFNALCLRYRPELPLVLRGVNLEIQGGEKVGVCGRTGAGKSSLLAALFRICEFASGSIRIDGVDIQSVRLRDLRRRLAIIPQDPVLFSGSLRENLDPFGEYSDNRIWTVLRLVHLSETVAKWNAGLDFVVSEKGDNLSVGQRQLMCIARALLKDSKIVVLDEATANVDTATDNLIQVTIKETFSNKTVLIIAHRINTILHCDKIAVMDAGQVAEFGPPSDLLSQPDSIFASLAKRSVQH